MRMRDVFVLPVLTPAIGWVCQSNGRRVLRSDGDDMEAERARANAAAHAINCHDDMLAALKHARDQIQHPDQMIDEAIAKAKGRP